MIFFVFFVKLETNFCWHVITIFYKEFLSRNLYYYLYLPFNRLGTGRASWCFYHNFSHINRIYIDLFPFLAYHKHSRAGRRCKREKVGTVVCTVRNSHTQLEEERGKIRTYFSNRPYFIGLFYNCINIHVISVY